MNDSVRRRTHNHTVSGCVRRWWLNILAASAAAASNSEQRREEAEAEQHSQPALAIPESTHKDRRKHEAASGAQPTKPAARIRMNT
jgi:hypothetical protein